MNWKKLSTLFFMKVYKSSNINQCVLCQAPSQTTLCHFCQLGIDRNLHHCRHCQRPMAEGLSLCGECQRHPPSYQHCIAPLRYEGTVKAMIQAIKFHQQQHYIQPLIELLCDQLNLHYRDQWPSQLLYVPSHPQRIRARGFCQTRAMAKQIQQRLTLQHEFLDLELLQPNPLSKRRHTQAQHTLPRPARIKAAKNVYQVDGQVAPYIALFDDVMTTGSTIESCCKTLHKAGAIKIDVWLIARTPDQDN